MVSNYERLIRPPQRSFFLFGMRGVGKSSWARAMFPKAAFLDLLDERLHQDLLADPSLFAQSIADRKAGDWVVVDEVQRLPALLNEVQSGASSTGLIRASSEPSSVNLALRPRKRRVRCLKVGSPPPCKPMLKRWSSTSISAIGRHTNPRWRWVSFCSGAVSFSRSKSR